MIHPLLNKDSASHYDNGKKASIYEHEKNATVAGMVEVAEFEIFKYTSRLGKKSYITEFVSDEHKRVHLEFIKRKDLKKIETWKNYKELLIPMLHKGYAKMSVRYAIDNFYPNMKYTLGD